MRVIRMTDNYYRLEDNPAKSGELGRMSEELDELAAVQIELNRAERDRDGRAYLLLCDQHSITPDNEELYAQGQEEMRLEREGMSEEEVAEIGGLENVVRQEEIVIDDSRFGDVTRSYLGTENIREQVNLRTKDSEEYARWIVESYLDSTARQRGYGVKVHMGALYFEKIPKRGRYRTEYSIGFEEDHDDADKTNPAEYQRDQLDVLRGLVSQKLPAANVVVRDNCLYVFPKQ